MKQPSDETKMTVLELLNRSTHTLQAHQIENPRLNAELLLAHSLNLHREGLYTHLHFQPKEREKEALEKLIQRRISGEPLQFILGHQEFWSIDFKVDPRVFIPRPETELLVEQSLKILSETSLTRTPFILEIGTGSGAIAIALAKEREPVFLVATDISREALSVAQENARLAGVQDQIFFVNGDLFGPFSLSAGDKKFDLILSNPPYIARPEIGSLAKEVREHEPIIALDGGEEGLEYYRPLISQAPFYLMQGGWLLLEIGEGQGAHVLKLLEEEGSFSNSDCILDLSGIKRVVRAQQK